MNDNLPVLADMHGAAERVAQEILELPPGRRAASLRRACAVYTAMAMVSGRSEREAARHGHRMQGLIGAAMSRLETRRAVRQWPVVVSSKG
jgi:hypothetical protein